MQCESIITLLTAALFTLTAAAISLVLTHDGSSSPPEQLCEGSELFTCRGTEVSIVLKWKLNESSISSYVFDPEHTYPLNVPATSPVPDSRVTMEVISAAVIRGSSAVDITSTLRVYNVSLLRGSSLHCEDGLGIRSNAINFAVVLPASPLLECSLRYFLGDLVTVLHWFKSFNSQHNVERYHVAVTPDPSSCSNDQVLPSEDYICSGLDPMRNYSITVSAVNCVDQEGASNTFSLQPQLLTPTTPLDIRVLTVFNRNGGLSLLTLRWMESVAISGNCSHSGAINYTLILEDSTGSTVERRVGSERCISGSCSITFSQLNQICSVSIFARNIFGASEITSTEIDTPRLTSTNQILLSLGTVLLCVTTIAVCIALTIMKLKAIKVFTAVTIFSLILFSLGVLVSLVLWLAVAFHVGILENTCDVAWQKTRDGLILSSFNFSMFSILIVIVAAVFAIGSVSYCDGSEHTTEERTTSHSNRGTDGVVYDEIPKSVKNHKAGAATTGSGEIKLKPNSAYQHTGVGKNKVTNCNEDYEN